MSGADEPTPRLLPYVDEDGMYQVRAADFDSPRRFPDWRDQVPTEIASIWGRMSIDARVVAYFMAKRLTDVIGAGSRG